MVNDGDCRHPEPEITDTAWVFLQTYVDFNGDIFDSMQAALDTNTPYAQDLALRLMAEVLQGNVP